MEFRKILALRGPNIWANFPVLEVWVHLGDLKDSPSHEIPGFNDRLKSWLPTMIEHRCGIGERGGFFHRLDTGTYLAHILEHVALELQTLAGTEVGYGRARESLGEGYYKVAIEYQEEAVARAALETGRELLMAAVYDRPFDVTAEVARLRALAQRECLGPSTQAIVRAATDRGIPYRRMNEYNFIQFGHGVHGRRIIAAQTDRTGAIAEEIAQDKELTRQLLASVGVPVPSGRPVENAEDAWSAAEDIGLPVVVKPQDGNQGRGVATNLHSREQVLDAYAAAALESSRVLVEKYIPGQDYRLLVVGGRVIAAARREPPLVIGDGKRTVAELVEEANTDPRRGDDHALPLSKIPLDAVSLGVLASQNLTPDAVPAPGACVLLRRNANLSTGGTACDVTSEVHPEVAARAIEAARMVGLDIAGVDVIASDIGRPLEEQSGAIVEVNAAPGLRMHVQPSAGTPQPVGEAIIDMLYPNGHNGRVPLVAVTGVNGKTTTTRLIAHIIQRTGKRVGVTCTDGIYIAGRRIDTGDCSGPKSARAVLLNPAVETAVLETARGGILREGLGFDRCDVAVVTNIAEGDHLGQAGIETVEELAKVKRCIVDVVSPTGAAVLNADDPLVAAMSEKCPGRTVFFARSGEHPLVVQHRERKGRAVFVRDHYITLADGPNEIALVSLSRVPLTHDGKVGFQVENALAAAAAAWSLGVPAEAILLGLETFAADLDSSPGRFNVFSLRGATLVIDYGHNPSALAALIDAVAQFPHERRLAVYSTAGDRRDEDMVKQGRLLGDAFDEVILYEDHYKRGRADGEIIRLFREGLSGGARVREVKDVQGAVKAFEAALSMVKPGDLLLAQADCIDETVDFVRRFLAGHERSAEFSVADALACLPEALVPASKHRP